MTDRLITKTFFDPVLAHELGLKRPYGVYLAVCAREKLALDAMLRARISGEMADIPAAEGSGFMQAIAWNDVRLNGAPEDADTKYYAPELILEKIDAMVGETFSKFDDFRGNGVTDVEGFKKALAPLALKIEKWLEAPRQHQNKDRLPRNTSFVKPDDPGTAFLLRMNGWDDVEMMQRDRMGDWWVSEPVTVDPVVEDDSGPGI